MNRTEIPGERPKKDISIIIPCHNAAWSLDRCWQSLRKQTLPLARLECIFVDDASTDGGKTRDVLERIEREAPASVKLLGLKENLRQGGARNAGLQYVTGTYLQFLDADDELLPDACETLFALAEEHRTDIIQFNHYEETLSGRELKQNCKENNLFFIEKPADRAPFLLSTLVTYGCWNKLYRMEMVRQSGARFAEHIIYEEPPFVHPQFFFAKRILLLDLPLYVYYGNTLSSTAVHASDRIADHPASQMQWLSWCLDHPDIFLQYRTEIEMYFLWSYFYETVLFARLQEITLPAELLEEMKHTVNTLFPDWSKNPYLKDLSEEQAQILNLAGTG